MSGEPAPRLLVRAREAVAGMMRGELVGDPELLRGRSPHAHIGGTLAATRLPPCGAGASGDGCPQARSKPTRQPLPFTKERQNCAECSVTAREKVRRSGP